MSEEKKNFVIKDRRYFSGDSQDSNQKEDSKKPLSEGMKEQTAGTVDKERVTQGKPEEAVKKEIPSEKEQEAEPQMPEINFSTFVLSLNASALVNLGIIENPATGKSEKNLSLAKQTIDILGILAEKTSGNLTEDEGNLLKNILYDLRINYVKQKK